MRKPNIFDIVFLENNRIIYSGVDTLYNLCLPKIQGQDDVFAAKQDIKGIVEQQWAACFPKREISFSGADEQIRYQNPLNSFFRFLHGEQTGYISDQDTQVKMCQEEATNMVLLYHIISELEKCHRNERIPDRFEWLCDCMSDLMGSEICYIFYSQRDQTELLSMSSFPEEMISDTITSYDELRTKIQKLRSNQKAAVRWQAANTIYVPEAIDNKDLAVIVLDFPKYPKKDWKGEWIYIVFQYKKESLDSFLTYEHENVSQSRCELLIRARNLLFLRQNFLNECMKQMYILLTSQRSYQYVCPLGNDKKIRILHLTDMHLDRKSGKLALKIANDFYDIIPEDISVDLLAITGDVVQASDSAGILEQNYVIADTFIRHLAARLWKKKNGKVRSDWQKRIIITTGNHDYASMNELQSMTVPDMKRATASGYPAKNEGGPMVKFAYYISFICRLLGLDVQKLIDNDLNELRCYRNLGLTVFAINTISQTGPLRTNKVLMNSSVVQQISNNAERDEDDPFNLILGHHGPQYEPDYFMDRYWFYSEVATNNMQKKWIYRFWDCMQLIKEKMGEATPEEKNDIKGMLSKLAEEIATNAKLDINVPESNALLWDIVRTEESLPEHFYCEQTAALYNSLKNDLEMTELDRTRLFEDYSQLFEKLKYQLSLSGHTHACATGGISFAKAKPEEKIMENVPFVVGDKMLKKDAFFAGLVTIDSAGKSIHWQMKVNSSYKKSYPDMTWNYK